jgi:hypothetical protein
MPVDLSRMASMRGPVTGAMNKLVPMMMASVVVAMALA